MHTHTRARVDQKIQLEMAEEKDWADHPVETEP